MVARYLQGPAVDELLARTDASGATSWYLTDRQGSVRNVASSAGSVVGTITYDGYGRQLTNTGATDKFGYDGMATDPNTGLAKADHRYYDAALGSWTQPDPIGFAGGDPDLYGYVGNSPGNRSDPSGLDWYDYIPIVGGVVVEIEALYVGGRESARGMELDEQRAQLLLAEQERSTATEMMLDPVQQGQLTSGSFFRTNGRTTQDAMCQYGDATGELKRQFAQAAAEEAAGRGGVEAAGGIFGALGWFFRKSRRASKLGRTVIRGIPVPEIKIGTSDTMLKEAMGNFKTTTNGWSAAEKAKYWEALATQIEAHHSPAWVSAALQGTKGEYIFSGKNINIHGMVITGEGKVLRIPQDCTITPDFTKPGTATVNYNNP